MALAKNRPAFSFLACSDSALLLEQIEILLNQFPPSQGAWERAVFWADEPPPAEFWDSLEQNSLFVTRKAVIVRNAQEWPAQVWKNLSASLSSVKEDIWPILCLEGAFEKNSPKIPQAILKSACYIHAEKKGWVWKKAPLTLSSLGAYAREKAKRKGLVFTPAALQLFCESILPNASCVSNEIEKLSLQSPDGNINEDMLTLNGVSLEADAFSCVRLLMEGNLPAVWREIARSDSSSLLFFLISLLSREFRLYWQILMGESPRMYPGEAAKKQSQARKMGLEKLARAFASLAEAEWQVKSGKLAPEQSLHKLVVNLSELCADKKI